jgi:hypothetical protein
VELLEYITIAGVCHGLDLWVLNVGKNQMVAAVMERFPVHAKRPFVLVAVTSYTSRLLLPPLQTHSSTFTLPCPPAPSASRPTSSTFYLSFISTLLCRYISNNPQSFHQIQYTLNTCWRHPQQCGVDVVINHFGFDSHDKLCKVCEYPFASARSLRGDWGFESRPGRQRKCSRWATLFDMMRGEWEG